MAENAHDTREDLKKSSDTNGSLPRIRTYAADMSRAIKARGATLSSIVTAEKQRTKKIAPEGEEKKRNAVWGFAALALVVLGIGVVTGAFFLSRNAPNTPDFSPSLIFPNKTILVPAEASVSTRLAAVRTDTDLSLGDIGRIILTENGGELSPQSVASRIGLSDALVRDVSDIMIGIHAFDRNQPFVIMRVGAFDRSFNALLSQEKDLGKALGAFFAPHTAPSATPNVPLKFNDAIIHNLDVRKSDDSWPILYVFPERTLIILTTNEFTLREILSRLGNQTR